MIATDTPEKDKIEEKKKKVKGLKKVLYFLNTRNQRKNRNCRNMTVTAVAMKLFVPVDSLLEDDIISKPLP